MVPCRYIFFLSSSRAINLLFTTHLPFYCYRITDNCWFAWVWFRRFETMHVEADSLYKLGRQVWRDANGDSCLQKKKQCRSNMLSVFCMLFYVVIAYHIQNAWDKSQTKVQLNRVLDKVQALLTYSISGFSLSKSVYIGTKLKARALGMVGVTLVKAVI